MVSIMHKSQDISLADTKASMLLFYTSFKTSEKTFQQTFYVLNLLWCITWRCTHRMGDCLTAAVCLGFLSRTEHLVAVSQHGSVCERTAPTGRLLQLSLVGNLKVTLSVTIKWASSWQKSFYAICEQQRRRSACASAQSDQHLCCLLPR